MSENTIDSAVAEDRAAIERWEGEGGSVLPPTEPVQAEPGQRDRPTS